MIKCYEPMDKPTNFNNAISRVAFATENVHWAFEENPKEQATEYLQTPNNVLGKRKSL